jgi:ABC-type anion transport system duplicated permease subunit
MCHHKLIGICGGEKIRNILAVIQFFPLAVTLFLTSLLCGKTIPSQQARNLCLVTQQVWDTFFNKMPFY